MASITGQKSISKMFGLTFFRVVLKSPGSIKVVLVIQFKNATKHDCTRQDIDLHYLITAKKQAEI